MTNKYFIQIHAHVTSYKKSNRCIETNFFEKYFKKLIPMHSDAFFRTWYWYNAVLSCFKIFFLQFFLLHHLKERIFICWKRPNKNENRVLDVSVLCFLWQIFLSSCLSFSSRQILPTCLIDKTDDSPEAFDKALSDGRPIIVYVHGNSGTRATHHRIRIYKRFQSLGYHTVAFDYRSKQCSTIKLCFEISRNKQILMHL